MPADPVLPSLISVVLFCGNSLENPFVYHFLCEKMSSIPIAKPDIRTGWAALEFIASHGAPGTFPRRVESLFWY